MGHVIEGENFVVFHDPEKQTVYLKGILRLNGLQEYGAIMEMLRNSQDQNTVQVIDLRELEFLNSSGIAMLSKYVIEARNRQVISLMIRGSKDIPWQGKSLVNLQRLMPALRLEIV